MLGSLLLLNVHDVGTLLVGRGLMGFGAGMASSNITAYIVDTTPTRPAWLASVTSSRTPMLGLAIGAIASGGLVQFGPWSLHLVCVAAIGGLLLVPALVGGELRTPSPLILGLVFAAYMAPSALSAPLGCRFTPAAAQRVGMIAFLAGMITIISAIVAGALVLFVAATVVAGAGQGIAISATTRGLLHGSSLADRAPIFSVIYLTCYSAAAFPSLIAGQLSNTFSLTQVTLGYGTLAFLATLITLVDARNPATTSPQGERS